MRHLVGAARRPGDLRDLDVLPQLSGSPYLLSSDRPSRCPADIIHPPRFHSGSIYWSHISFWVCQQLPDSLTNCPQLLICYISLSPFAAVCPASPSRAVIKFVCRHFALMKTRGDLFLFFLCAYTLIALYGKHTFLEDFNCLSPICAVRAASSCQTSSCLLDLHLSSSIASSTLVLSCLSLFSFARRADNLFLFISRLWPAPRGKRELGK